MFEPEPLDRAAMPFLLRRARVPTVKQPRFLAGPGVDDPRDHSAKELTGSFWLHGCVFSCHVVGNLSSELCSINMKSSDAFTIIPAQIRAGRALVKLSAEDLAERAKVGIATVRRAESEGGPKTSAVVLNALRLALEAAGVEFLATNDGGPGVRLKERKS
ncbi:hypothetical protein [Paracoccus sp. 22332]|uniref:hypothetical protein n=1 Tax=Paracoccus sp. 22332 TaxID=3453913 RepID=UPI003F83894F